MKRMNAVFDKLRRVLPAGKISDEEGKDTKVTELSRRPSVHLKAAL